MILVQIFLPLYNNNGEKFDMSLLRQTREEILEAYNGITTYTRSPARGLWKDEEDHTIKDDIVIYEVLTESFDKKWWEEYKEKLIKRFQQEELLIRGFSVITV